MDSSKFTIYSKIKAHKKLFMLNIFIFKNKNSKKIINTLNLNTLNLQNMTNT